MQVKVAHLDLNSFNDSALVIGLHPDKNNRSGQSLKLLKKIVSNSDNIRNLALEDNQVLPFRVSGISKVPLVFLLGIRPDASTWALNSCVGDLCDWLRKFKLSSCTIIVDGFLAGADYQAAAQHLAELAVLGSYQYTRYKKPATEKLTRVTLSCLAESEQAAVRKGAKTGAVIGAAVNFTRDLQNHPGNWLTPSRLADEAKKMCRQSGIACEVLGKKEIEALKMGAFLGVAQGTQEPPRFIIMKYSGGKKGAAPYVIVGKGITFDSGGISLKSNTDMDEMKFDMSGAAAVLGCLKAASELRMKQNLVGLIPATENLPSGTSLRPGDILTASSGVTIEVLNTDSEGRLILADALAFAKRFQPAGVIDLATLTGGCIVALGHHASGLMGNDQDLIDGLRTAGDVCGERVWPLPLWQNYFDDIKGTYADIKNSVGRAGNAITAGAFLGTFTKEYRWAHLDIAGTAYVGARQGVFDKGGTGVGVRLLMEFLRRRTGS